MPHRHPVNQALIDHAAPGVRLADATVGALGSWRFLIIQTVVVGAWIAANLVGFVAHWDPYPFILLNLLFSTQAAYAAPLILLSGNRQADKDRLMAEHDVSVNERAEALIEELTRGLAENTALTRALHERLCGPSELAAGS